MGSIVNNNDIAQKVCNIEKYYKLCCSRGVFINVNLRTGSLYLWMGSQSPESLQANGRRIAQWMSDRCPMEVGLSLESSVIVTEIKEGTEPREFLRALKSDGDSKYHNLVKGMMTVLIPSLFIKLQ